MRLDRRVLPGLLVVGTTITIIGRVVFENELLVIVGILTVFLPVLIIQIVPSYRSMWRASRRRRIEGKKPHVGDSHH